jgi:hypothetical protein
MVRIAREPGPIYLEVSHPGNIERTRIPRLRFSLSQLRAGVMRETRGAHTSGKCRMCFTVFACWFDLSLTDSRCRKSLETSTSML